MSVWQVAAGARVNVLSLGGESTSLTPAAVEYIRSFPVRIVWMDKESLATEKAKQVNGHATWSGEGDEKQDANDLLQRMTLQRRVADLLTLAGALPEDVREVGG